MITNFVYDEHNLLVSETKGTLNTSYAYYKNGLRKTMIDSIGTTQYNYNNDNSLGKIIFPDTKTIEYEYDIAGNRTKLIEPFAQVWNYNYDQQNRLRHMTIGTSQTQEVDLSYKPNGLLDIVTQANGMKTSYSFDGLNRLTSLLHKDATNDVVRSYAYTYDDNGNRLTETENGITNTYAYDEVNRIISNSQGNETYTYDKAGNRSSHNSSFAFIGDDTIEYKYDEYNRLIEVIKNDVLVETNKYNGDGLLVEKTQDGITTRYYYDGANIIAEGTVQADGTVSLNARYLRSGTQLVSREDSTGLKGYYLHNGHGDVVELRGISGNILASYNYDIWGNSISINESGMINPFRYCGELYDNTSGLYYLRARHYDPSMGRFISEDSYLGNGTEPLSLNLYTYCANNPILYFDPSGNYYIQKQKNGMFKLVKDNLLLLAGRSALMHYVPFGDFAVSQIENSKFFNYTGGNSKVVPSSDVNLELFADSSKFAKKLVSFYNVYQTGTYVVEGLEIALMDEISFTLLRECGISLFADSEDRLNETMTKAYSFINSAPGYFKQGVGSTFGNKSLFELDLQLSKSKNPKKLLDKYYDNCLGYYINLGYSHKEAKAHANGVFRDLNLESYSDRITEIKDLFKQFSNK